MRLRTRRRIGCLFGVVAALLLLVTAHYYLLPNYPVHFHGRVVDKNGSPIGGVSVVAGMSYETSISPIPWTGTPPKLVIVKTATDDDGRFIISGRGASLSMAFEKAGYDDGQTSTPLDRFSFGLHAGGGVNASSSPVTYTLLKTKD